MPPWGAVVKVRSRPLSAQPTCCAARTTHDAAALMAPCLWVQVSPTGEVLEFLMDPEGKHVPFITAVKEAASPAPGAKARLFMGSVPASERWVAYLDI